MSQSVEQNSSSGGNNSSVSEAIPGIYDTRMFIYPFPQEPITCFFPGKKK